MVVTVALSAEGEVGALEADDDCSGEEETCPCLEVSDGALDVVALPLGTSERLEDGGSWIGE